MSKYTWQPFFTELLQTLPRYQNKRAELKNLGIKVLREVGTDDFKPLSEIDPFTFLGTFMRAMPIEKRLAVMQSIKTELLFNASTATDLDGLPRLTGNYWFTEGLADTQVVDDLWQLFLSALALDIKNASTRAAFIAAYEHNLNNNAVNERLTLILNWLRPDFFVYVSKATLDLAFERFDRKTSNQMKALAEGLIHGENYLKLCELFQQTLQAQGEKLLDFTSRALVRGEGTAYFWLNVSVTHWQLSQTAVGATKHFEPKSRRTFSEVKPGDRVIACDEITKMATASLSVSTKAEGAVDFVVDEKFPKAVVLTQLQTDPLLGDLMTLACQKNLVRLRKKEYDHVLKLAEVKPYTRQDFLNDVFMSQPYLERIERRLRLKKNIILQGPPGVGKTYIAKRLAQLQSGSTSAANMTMVQFHQSYTYGDLMLGYVPDGANFKRHYGSFYNLVQQAIKMPSQDFFFIIDEINRGNISKIFGELLMLLEADKRRPEYAVTLTDGDLFYIPQNIYLIGTMNTADRGLTRMDYALRRRFDFFSISPAFENSHFKNLLKADNSDIANNLVTALQDINHTIANDAALGPDYLIGHSYVMNQNKIASDVVLQDAVVCDILPQLREYWWNTTNENYTDAKKRLRRAADLDG